MDYFIHDLAAAGLTDLEIVDRLVARGSTLQHAWDRVDIYRTI